VGDAPPYQGHVVTIAARTGRVVRVWNALCSNRHRLINPSTCSESGSAIWARSGVVVDPATGGFLVATGDGRFNGKTHWGDSVLHLSRKLRLLRNWTPTDANALESGDVDLGSTAPALIGRVFAVQGGKDGKLRLLSRRRLGGKLGRKGGELQTVSTPGGEGLFSAPAVSGNRVYVATGSGLWCYVLSRGRLHVAWRSGDSGTSPVLAGGLLYVYDAFGGGLRAYSPSTGRRLAGYRLPAGHWNSPIVTDGRIAVPTGDANEHRVSGSLYILSRT
jgi:hypothetical protein